MKAAHRLGLPLRAEPGGPERRKLSLSLRAYLGRARTVRVERTFLERNADDSKLTEYAIVSSFLDMSAINVAAIRELADR